MDTVVHGCIREKDGSPAEQKKSPAEAGPFLGCPDYFDSVIRIVRTAFPARRTAVYTPLG